MLTGESISVERKVETRLLGLVSIKMVPLITARLEWEVIQLYLKIIKLVEDAQGSRSTHCSNGRYHYRIFCTDCYKHVPVLAGITWLIAGQIWNICFIRYHNNPCHCLSFVP